MTEQTSLKHLLENARIKLSSSKEVFPSLHQSEDTGLPMLVIENSIGRAVIALQGAHVMAFQPIGQRELLWVSPKCVLEEGKPIRGGIPLCIPWFGPGLDGKLMHGFGRTTAWSLTEAEIMGNGATRLVLELHGDVSTCALWPHAFSFRLDVMVGKELRLDITAKNHGTTVAPFAFAFHTYFDVVEVAKCRTTGLENTVYIDKLDNQSRKTQHGDVSITGPTDRIYLEVPQHQTIIAPCGNTRIESDTHCAVVWNAWTNDKNMPDLGEGNHVGYLCVERGEVADHTVQLAPGASIRRWMTLMPCDQ